MSLDFLGKVKLIAAGVLDGSVATPAWIAPIVGFSNTVGDNGAGDYTLNFDTDMCSIIVAGRTFFAVTVIGTAPLEYAVEKVSTTSIRTRFINNAAAATEAIFSIMVFEIYR